MRIVRDAINARSRPFRYACRPRALRTAALQGLGIVLQPTILLEADVRAGRLVQLFPEYGLPERPMHIVYLPDRYRSPKLRSFIDFVLERFGEA